MESEHGGGTVGGRGEAAGRMLRLALAVFFVALIAMPLVQQVTGWPRDAQLGGVEVRPARPRLTRGAWFSGGFAVDYDAWYQGSVGLRGFLVKLGNQARYLAFGRGPASTGTQVMIGRDHWLFEDVYVRHWRKRPPMEPAKARLFARRLRRLQERLAARGVAFALVISPSKAEIYPEHLPRGVTRSDGEDRAATSYEILVPLLERAGVRVVDASADFLRWRTAEPGGPPLFPSLGTHWTFYGAYRVTAELLGRLKEEARLDVDPPTLARVRYGPAAESDIDLLRLLNLFWFQPGGPPSSPFPVTAPSSRPFERRLDVLLVGDSFGGNLVSGLFYSRAVRTVDYQNYFREGSRYELLQEFPGERSPSVGITRSPVRLNSGSLRRLLLSKQLVILEINEVQLDAVGWSFPEAALAALRKE